MHYQFEWDPAKAIANKRKHGVSFEEARTVFADLFAVESFDVEHSVEEDRFMIVGVSESDRSRFATIGRFVSSVLGRHAGEKSKSMKKTDKSDDDPLDREIDFSKARPNPYWLGVVDKQCVRLIDKDLTEIFPDNDAVNAALRTIAEAAKHTRRRISASRVAEKKERG